MTEKLREYYLKALDGIEWGPLAFVYRQAGIEEKDAQLMEKIYPGMSGVYTWLARIPESKREDFEKILPNFGIKVLYSLELDDQEEDLG